MNKIENLDKIFEEISKEILDSIFDDVDKLGNTGAEPTDSDDHE